MSSEFILKQHDTLPILTAILKDANGVVINLAATTVTFKMGTENSTKITGATTVTDTLNGAVKYEWQANDTDTAGIFLGEFEVVHASGKRETFPNNEPFRVVIRPDVI